MVCLCCWEGSWPERQRIRETDVPSTKCCAMPLVPSALSYSLRRFVRKAFRSSLLVACVLLCMSGVPAGRPDTNAMSSDLSADPSLPSVDELVPLGDDIPGTTNDQRAQDQEADGSGGAAGQSSTGLTVGGAEPAAPSPRRYNPRLAPFHDSIAHTYP